jgi:hypothetical protein
MAVLGFSECYDLRCVVGCEYVLEVNDGGVHTSRVERE